MSASLAIDFCGRCQEHADACECQHCEHCARWVGYWQDDAPSFCAACEPLFRETIPPPPQVAACRHTEADRKYLGQGLTLIACGCGWSARTVQS